MTSMRPLHGLLALLALLTVSLQILSLDLVSTDPYTGFVENSGVVRKVHPGSPAERAGLEPGDRILSVNHVAVRYPHTAAQLAAWSREAEIDVLYQRGGSTRGTAVVPTAPSSSEILWRMALAAVAIGTLLTGLIVLLKKTRPVTLTFFGLCYSLGFLLQPPEIPRNHGMVLLTTGVVELVSALLPALFVHFFLLFPARREVLDRRPATAVLLYIPSVALFVCSQCTHVAQAALSIDVDDIVAALDAVVGAMFVLGIAVSLVLFIRAYMRANIPSLRRRFHVTFIGTIAGVIPTLVVFLLHTFFPQRSIPGDRLAVIALIFVPASFGYAIVRHGIFELDRIVRRSLAITLLTSALILIYFATYFVLKEPLAKLTGTHGFTPTLLALLLILLLFSPVRSRLQRFFDRDLPSEGSSNDRSARSFGRRMRSVFDWNDLVREMVDGVVQRVGSRAALFYEGSPDGNGMALTYSCGVRMGILGQAALGHRVLQAVERLGGPVQREDLDAELPFGWLSEDERRNLDRIDARVLSAVRGKERSLGLLVLGPPVHGGTYEGWQLELFDDLLDQSALALENASFHREAIREARLHYDLRVARSLQSQLLPRSAPELPNVELAGQTVPSQDVGGDYYDFVLPHDDHLVLGIGDVSGKGVPGALLMAHLQAIFRAEASESYESPSGLLARVNRRICDIQRPDRFISLFCATFHVPTRTLRYASAGHPPALVARKDGSLEQLEHSGLLLGIQSTAEYPSGEVLLTPGDLVVCYTDGAVEREGATGPVGEEGLGRAILRHRHLSARDLTQRLLAEVRHASANPMEDDTTFLVLKTL